MPGGRPKGSKNISTLRREQAEKAARVKKMMAEDDGPAYFVCACCGKRYAQQKENFAPSQSNLWKGNNYYIPVCRNCIDKLFDHYTKVLGSEEEAAKRICMKFDIYFSQSLLDSTGKHAPNITRMRAWIKQTNMIQYRGKTFDDYLQEVDGRIISDPDDVLETKGKVSQRMLEFWGPGFNENDYIQLDREYKDWTSRYECKTKAQEILFRNISMAQLVVNKAYRLGDPKELKTASDNLQNLLGSANIKPNQTNDNALAENNTPGMLIEKWEKTRPIPEPAPEWRDVDKIGYYIRVWLLGPILEMFKLKNPWKEEYDKELERYSAQKPEYTSDSDEENESLRKIVFGEE